MVEKLLARPRAPVKRVREFRIGVAAYFTIDAGPHVKVLCASSNAAKVEAALAPTPSLMRVLRLAPGPGAQVTSEQRERYER